MTCFQVAATVQPSPKLADPPASPFTRRLRPAISRSASRASSPSCQAALLCYNPASTAKSPQSLSRSQLSRTSASNAAGPSRPPLLTSRLKSPRAAAPHLPTPVSSRCCGQPLPPHAELPGLVDPLLPWGASSWLRSLQGGPGCVRLLLQLREAIKYGRQPAHATGDPKGTRSDGVKYTVVDVSKHGVSEQHQESADDLKMLL